jgi:DNA-binding beta-propeller fold protein YncE
MVPAIWNSESNAIGAKAREEPANEACRGEDFIDELRSPRHLENLDRRGLKMFRRIITTCAASAFLLMGMAQMAQAEILAMMNYESKTEDNLKALKLSGPAEREEGIAIVDVDPNSGNFGKVLVNIPLPADLVAHHIFYDRTMTKAYVTALGKGELRVIDMKTSPYRVKVIPVPDCVMGEDLILSEDNSTWYLTCMMSANVIVGSVATDEITGIISIPNTYPHGLGVHSGINRLIVTSTVSGDLTDKHEIVTILDATSHEILGQHKLSLKESPSEEGPVEVLFLPSVEKPTAYVTNIFGGTLWAMVWNEEKSDFDVHQAFDFATLEAGVALEMYVNDAGDRLYVTTGVPGQLHFFDISADPTKPKHLKTLPAGQGAHHVAFTKDERYAFVQNALLNLPGMSDGTITVVDLEKQEVVATVDSLQAKGLNPNSIVLLPEWNSFAGH